MEKESDAHETLSLLFTQEGVPSTQVMDGAREQVIGEFRHTVSRLFCEADRTLFPMEKCSRKYNKRAEEKCWKEDDQGQLSQEAMG